MNLPAPENTPEIDKAERRNKALLWFIAVGVGALVLSVGVGFYLRIGDSAKQSTTEHSVQAVLQSNARRDCVTAYNSIFTEVDRQQRIAASDGQITLGKYLIGDPTITPDVLKKVGTEVSDANAALKALPQLSDAVDKGFSLGGKTYPRCPVVK